MQSEGLSQFHGEHHVERCSGKEGMNAGQIIAGAPRRAEWMVVCELLDVRGYLVILALASLSISGSDEEVVFLEKAFGGRNRDDGGSKQHRE